MRPSGASRTAASRTAAGPAAAAPAALRHVLPASWGETGGRASVGGLPLADLAARFGTPLVVVDERHLSDRLAAFRGAFGPAVALAYAGKAFLCGALVRLLDRAGWFVDVVSGGELELVQRAGFPMGRVLLHGNAKSAAELERAVALGVGRIVVDHPDEIGDLRRAISAVRDSGAEGPRPAVRGAGPAADIPGVLLRLNVDLAPDTHEKVKTVGPAAHFGMGPSTAAGVARELATARDMRLTGVHIHAGSQIRDPGLFARVATAAVDFVAPLRDCFPETVALDLGGGLAAPYRAGERVPSPRRYAAALRAGLRAAEARARLGPYRLIVEPGRSVIANAGLTLYRVHARKRLEGADEVLAVDGGLSDNPRPSLYGASYEVLNASRPPDGAGRAFRVVGRHCESGDVVAPSVLLPGGSAVGDVLAVPATGAYVFSMSSRYNGVGRPAVVFVRDGEAREVVRRETDDDLLACDLALGDSRPGANAPPPGDAERARDAAPPTGGEAPPSRGR